MQILVFILHRVLFSDAWLWLLNVKERDYDIFIWRLGLIRCLRRPIPTSTWGWAFLVFDAYRTRHAPVILRRLLLLLILRQLQLPLRLYPIILHLSIDLRRYKARAERKKCDCDWDQLGHHKPVVVREPGWEVEVGRLAQHADHHGNSVRQPDLLFVELFDQKNTYSYHHIGRGQTRSGAADIIKPHLDVVKRHKAEGLADGD